MLAKILKYLKKKNDPYKFPVTLPVPCEDKSVSLVPYFPMNSRYIFVLAMGENDIHLFLSADI